MMNWSSAAKLYLLALGLLLAAPVVYVSAVGVGMAAGDTQWMSWCDAVCREDMQQRGKIAGLLAYVAPVFIATSIGIAIWATVLHSKRRKALR